jgi:hypothetical protein
MPSTLNPQACNIADFSAEDRIKLAIEAIEKSGLKLNGDTIYSVRAAAKDFDIPRSTLGNHLKGISHCFHLASTQLITIQADFLEKKLMIMSNFCRHPKKRFLWNG